MNRFSILRSIEQCRTHHAEKHILGEANEETYPTIGRRSTVGYVPS
jgi:hypothetical protein